ncbi:urease accessory protein UreF [Mycobacterium sp. M1]|uniref:Urease accessory protein UreF n=1 Tax=Mycolicibacter acidiphilus TaxID=2835306 RepID=A0ABS5RJV7_9MYCO|nr:urease accessory UreF family protein [Mycolicibacter acidiphilus]MBS9533873.1 urease accessory protein UreF [Mycolicibacter acidiphilus]
MSRAALLLLADGRFPAGGYAHSGGLEASIAAGRVCGVADLDGFLRGRATTTGLVAGAFAAATCSALAREDWARIDVLDAEFDARTPSPATREVSRTLGRQLQRTVTRMRPDPRLHHLGRAPHQALAFGAAATVFGVGPHDAALAALHESVTGPATAAVRLLPVDPFDVHAVLGGLAGLLDELADRAAALTDVEPVDLPAAAAPLLDIAAEAHRRTEGRLFAS